MKTEKLSNGRVRVEYEESELHVVQFLAKFFLSIPRPTEIPRQVFAGRFMRRVRRLHDSLEEVS
jgi:hypothetical protein